MHSKELLKGTLEVMILRLLSENEKMYGYQMAIKVKELSEGKILLKDGSLYPALHKMTKDGILSFKEENIGKRVRKYYYMTPNGIARRDILLIELQDFISTLKKVIFDDYNLLAVT